MKHLIRIFFATFALLMFGCADISDSEMVEAQSAPFVFGADARVAEYPALPIYRIRIRQGDGTYQYCTATVYSAALKHFVTDARCFFTIKNGLPTQVALSDISIQWVTGGSSWSTSITHVMIAPGYTMTANSWGDNVVDPRQEPSIARSYAFFRTNWTTSAGYIPMETSNSWFTLNCDVTTGQCGNPVTFVAVGAQAVNSAYTACDTVTSTISEPANCQANRLYFNTFSIRPAMAAMPSCYKSWCNPSMATPPFAGSAGDCLIGDGDSLYGTTTSNHFMDVSSNYGAGATNRGGDLGGPVLNSSRTKIMGIMSGTIVKGIFDFNNVWIPTVEIMMVKHQETVQGTEYTCPWTRLHDLSVPYEHAGMWEYANYFSATYP